MLGKCSYEICIRHFLQFFTLVFILCKKIIKFSNFLSICKKFDEISDRCKEISDKTSELVELEEYVKNASTVRVLQLQNEVDGAAERLLFLLDYANFPCKFQCTFYHHVLF